MERIQWNAFKKAARMRDPPVRRGYRYYKELHAAYLAQSESRPTLDQWIVPPPAMADRDNFMTDFENWCLQYRWDSSQHAHPRSPTRWQDPEWAEMMRRACENHSDVSFEQYCEWCTGGGGDDWFKKPNFYDTYQAEFPGELQVEL